MPRPLALALALVPLLLLAAALGGCTPSTRLPPPEPSSAGEPLFASDEEALAAATAAYEEYLAVVDGALSDPTQSVEFSALIDGDALAEVEHSRKEFVEQGYRLQGSRVVGGAELQQSFALEGVTTVVVYFCEDVSGVTLLDRNGRSLTTEDRPRFSIFETSIEFEAVDFKVTQRQFWDNVESC
jgi:hypothetical protein